MPEIFVHLSIRTNIYVLDVSCLNLCQFIIVPTIQSCCSHSITVIILILNHHHLKKKKQKKNKKKPLPQ